MALVVGGTILLPVTLGDDNVGSCWSISVDRFADRLRVIATPGREIALGLTADSPGEGVGLVMYIAPSTCTGLGGVPPLTDSASAASGAPSYPALP